MLGKKNIPKGRKETPTQKVERNPGPKGRKEAPTLKGGKQI
jgi:hypothetical protein